MGLGFVGDEKERERGGGLAVDGARGGNGGFTEVSIRDIKFLLDPGTNLSIYRVRGSPASVLWRKWSVGRQSDTGSYIGTQGMYTNH